MPKVRKGKTQREHKSGVWNNRFSNRADRVAWEKDNKVGNESFPKHACNGKRNRQK